MKRWCGNETVLLLHGDALELPGSARAQVFVTDPPYARAGAASTGRYSKAGKAADAQGSEQFWLYWFKDIAKLLCERTERCGFVFCDYRTIHLVERAFAASGTGWTVTQALIWDRESMGLGSPFRAGHEMIAFARSPSFVWDGPRDVRNVLRFRWPYGAHEHHSAEKPVELLSHLIGLISQPGETVLDLFAGSGSTLVAAAQSNRRAIGVEMEEHHCATAAHRLQSVVLGARAQTAQLALEGVVDG